MSKVNDILENKGRFVFSVEPKVMVLKAIELMCEKYWRALICEADQLVGIFTERDYARKLILKGKSSKDTPIGELMTPHPFTVAPETSIEDCMELMTEKHIRHLPVIEKGKLIGMISIGDVVKQIIKDQKNIIEHLESYITR